MHKSVLLIENDTVLKELIQALDWPFSMSITQADQAFIGLKLASSEKFDFIFVDLMLHQVDGLDIIRLLKWHPMSQSSRLIATSRQMNGAQEATTLAAGANYFLRKPIRSDELIGALTN
jgi:DNA-binding response OmpR family regulator